MHSLLYTCYRFCVVYYTSILLTCLLTCLLIPLFRVFFRFHFPVHVYFIVFPAKTRPSGQDYALDLHTLNVCHKI